MIPKMSRYLDRLYATIHSRQEITVEEFYFFDHSDVLGHTSELFIRLCFWDGSLLQVEEALLARMFTIIKVRCSYHYQRADGRRVFRYDNAPHYPDLPGFPAHKHEGDRVVPAPAPDLSEVLQEIDGHLYPSG